MSASRNEPIKHTCPDIDDAIGVLKDVIKEIDIANFNTDTWSINDCDFSGWISNIESIAEGHRCVLEDLRKSNSTLGEWGNELVSDLDDKDKEIENLNDEIRKLEGKISDNDDYIDDLKLEIRELNELQNA